jgi:hypothetical protein
MIINGTEYRYRIQPRWKKVHAEIFYIFKYSKEIEIHLIDKSFKRLFRPISDKDYQNAKAWCENHIKNISESNRQS